jgi:hypothetical protein
VTRTTDTVVVTLDVPSAVADAVADRLDGGEIDKQTSDEND